MSHVHKITCLTAAKNNQELQYLMQCLTHRHHVRRKFLLTDLKMTTIVILTIFIFYIRIKKAYNAYSAITFPKQVSNF